MKIVTIFWILLAVLCGGYGLLIRAIGSGTGFFLVWIGTGSHFRGMFGSSTGRLVGNNATVSAESDIGIVMSDIGTFYRNWWLHRK